MTDADALKPICEMVFTSEDGQERLLAQLFPPVLVDSSNGEMWGCQACVIGDAHNLATRAMGADSYQAVVMGLTWLRKAFTDLGGNYTSESGAPVHIFPRFIPSCYGDDRYEELCRFVDEKVGVWEAEITERRERWERTRKHD